MAPMSLDRGEWMLAIILDLDIKSIIVIMINTQNNELYCSKKNPTIRVQNHVWWSRTLTDLLLLC